MSKDRTLEVQGQSCSRVRSLGRMLIPSVTVFFAGGCLVVLLLVASRLVARSVGSSLYTWTSILSVVLASLSLGHYLGGRLVDRYDARRILAVLFGLASAACIGMVVVNNGVGEWWWLWRLSWPGHVFLHVLLVLLLPSTLLGTVFPVVTQMAVCRTAASGHRPLRMPPEGGGPTAVPTSHLTLPTSNLGRTTGNIYAWGMVGGLAGALLATFAMIPGYGNVFIIWLLGAALLLMAVLYWVSCWVMYLWGMVFIALLTMGISNDPWAQDAGTKAWLRQGPDPNLVYAAQTPGGYVAVRRIARRPDTRAFVQDRLTRGEMAIHDASCLSEFYLKVYAGLTDGLTQGRKDPSLLVLGAGAYVLPRYLKATWPHSRVEVVEVDPGVTQAALQAFGLDRNLPIETITMDPRSYVNRLAQGGPAGQAPQPRYDFIYEEAQDDQGVPSQLLTKECNDEIAGLLADGGAYLLHLPAADRGGRLLGAVVNTARATFPCVYVIAGRTSPLAPASPGRSASQPTDSDAAPGRSPDDVVIAATRHPIAPQEILAGHYPQLKFTILDDAQMADLKDRWGDGILTDDYAPVDHLLAPAVKDSATEFLVRKYLDQAKELQAAGQYETSMQWYGRVLELDPARATEAYDQIGVMCLALNQSELAITAFRNALRSYDETGNSGPGPGAVHLNLGLLLGRTDKQKEGKEQLAQAVAAFRVELQENPHAVVTWEQLGDTCAALGDFPGASEAFSQAVALEPRTGSHYRKLARALELQHRYEEAIAVVQQHVQLVREQGRRDQVVQLAHYIDVLRYNKVKEAGRAAPQPAR